MLDYKSVFIKDHKENLKIFSDLKTIKEFSAYANDLNRAFGDNSYNHFHKNLIEPKQSFKADYFNIFQKKEDKKNKYKIKLKLFEDNYFNIKKIEESLANMKLKEKILNEKIKNPYIERMKKSPLFMYKKEIEKQKASKKNKLIKSVYNQVPPVGRYFPKYNSINKHSYRAFFGNMPTNRFYTIEQEIVKNDKNKDSLEDEENFQKRNYKFVIKNNLFNKNNKKFIKNRRFSLRKIIINEQGKLKDSQNFDSIRENKSEKIFNIKNNSHNISRITDNNSFSNENFIDESSNKSRNNSSLELDKNSIINKSFDIKKKRDNNHCLRFEAYMGRKPLTKTIIYNTDIKDELPNYYTSKYIKNTIDYNRNRHIPNYIEQAIMRDQNPPLGFYQPKYNYIFNNLDKNVYINKKYSYLGKNHLKKIFCDYNVSKEYQTVPKLNDQATENVILNTEINNKNKHKIL